MPAPPSRDVVRDPRWRVGLGVVLAAVAFAFAGGLVELVTLWATNADYSHGFLVVPFVAYLLWTRRGQFPATIGRWPDPRGLLFFAAAVVIYVAADRLNIAREWLMSFAVLVALAGVVVMFCGRWKGLAWAWPAFVLLPLTFQLPHRVEQTVSLRLREFATDGANFAFQTFGLPTYAEGNRILIDNAPLVEVAEACSGLSMLMVFVTLAAAIFLLATARPLTDRLVVLFSAVPIAVGCNLVRIVATGLVYHAGWTRLGHALVHDLFGWAMMPLALALIWIELRLLAWVVVPEEHLTTREALGLSVRRRPGGPVAGPPAGPAR